MTASKHTDDLETPAQEREKAKQQLNYWTQREKILSHRMAQLTPKERTHRLRCLLHICTIATSF